MAKWAARDVRKLKELRGLGLTYKECATWFGDSAEFETRGRHSCRQAFSRYFTAEKESTWFEPAQPSKPEPEPIQAFKARCFIKSVDNCPAGYCLQRGCIEFRQYQKRKKLNQSHVLALRKDCL